jgi:hypothetical protein
MSDVAAHGPIDFILLEFTGDGPRGATAGAIADLLNRGVVRLYDVAAVRKDADGATEIVDLAEESLGGIEVFGGLRSGLLSDDDLAAAAAVLEPGTIGVLLVYENTWAVPFVAAALAEGAAPVASARIPALDVIAALDELDARD